MSDHVLLLHTKKSAALTLSVSVSMIERLMARGLLSYKKLGKRVLFSHQELQRFARADLNRMKL